ncbi:hypothetical protein [Anaerococcus prevotii]|uniref:Uncharacterized protein n=1 Tax=Anaerococcus prevotii ACS-065-V-Col13 TaxID=879305 RepID=F0GVM2_9FIRM|nr:hypothetical protein [Anaerococcus prevotii]EGC82123.1 hypothetical protein HMPREF9290_1078 [Anaerococcus prevotii ACS-065-V-Col13]
MKKILAALLFIILVPTSFASGEYKDIKEIRGDKNHYYDLAFSYHLLIVDESQIKPQANVKNDTKSEAPSTQTKGRLADDKVISELSGKSFVLSSGAGAWASFIDIKDNKGNFEIEFSDADMGHIYLASGRGQFEMKEKIDDYTYKLKVKNFERTSPEPGIYDKDSFDRDQEYLAVPHGLETSDLKNPKPVESVTLYLPFKNINEIPDDEGARAWLNMSVSEGVGKIGNELRVFAIVNGGYPFVEMVGQ